MISHLIKDQRADLTIVLLSAVLPLRGFTGEVACRLPANLNIAVATESKKTDERITMRYGRIEHTGEYLHWSVHTQKQR
jgi:hypothetical protein